MTRERLEFLTDNALDTKCFAYPVGRRCRNSTIKEMAEELHLDWHSVKELVKQYTRAQLARAGIPAPEVIGIDEIAVRKHHPYRIVVSDLMRGQAIRIGGKDRSEASMGELLAWLGEKTSRGIRLALRIWPAAVPPHSVRCGKEAGTSLALTAIRTDCTVRAMKAKTTATLTRSGVEEARKNLPALLERASQGHPCLVTKHGRDYAAIVPPDYLEQRKPGPSILALKGTGKGLWGRSVRRTIERIRGEWD